jgi:hypothetical protein
MQALLPIEVFEALEKNLGHDDAKIVLKSFETAISANIEYTWVTTKDDLLSEMEKKFATKSDIIVIKLDIMLVKTELAGDINHLETKLEGKIDKVKIELAGKIDHLETKLEDKIDKVMVELAGNINNVETKLEGKIDKVKIELEGKIDKVKIELEGKIDKVKIELEGKIDHLETRIEGKINLLSAQFRLSFYIIIFVIIISNPKALEFISKIYTLVKMSF